MPLITDKLIAVVLTSACLFPYPHCIYAESSTGKPGSDITQPSNDTVTFDPPFLYTEDTLSAELPDESIEPDVAPVEITTETEETSLDTEYVVETEETEPPFFSFLDEHQQAISSRLKRYTQGIDNFFTDDSVFSDETGSYLRLRLESNWPEGSGMSFKGRVSLKLRLPKTQKKLKLVVSSDVDEQKSALERETGEITTRDDNQRGLFTGIEKDTQRGSWKLRPSIGIKIRSPLDWYARVRASRQWLFDKWIMNFNQSFYWFDSTGYGADSTLRWDRGISDKFLFRSESFLRYTDLLDYYEMSQTFSIIHTLSHKRAITYKVGAFGQTEDPAVHATTYLLNALYRNNIHKDYLFLDIQPQILFEKDNDFKGRLELFVRLEIFYRG